MDTLAYFEINIYLISYIRSSHRLGFLDARIVVSAQSCLSKVCTDLERKGVDRKLKRCVWHSVVLILFLTSKLKHTEK